MIQGFEDETTKEVFEGRVPRRFPTNVFQAARRKLLQLDAAAVVEDMRIPPGNRLEALQGDRAGQWSVRVNDQYRICFIWGPRGPANVEFVDYH
ncbi:type II toxin-antitoxin system RelE/ParE family toxin [Phenylobacterium sp. LjRoot164]|uniref:type II toxin-antitoxin system RelE/ParE family toxin n=1 Tax=unclassified Phenylobacterium TaxID=2640670 RepID=UPI003ED096E4